MLINFTCPEYNTLTGVVEVKVGNIVVRSEITEIEDGVGYYDNPHCEGGEISHYECSNCQNVLIDFNDETIKDEDDLYSYLEEMEEENKSVESNNEREN